MESLARNIQFYGRWKHHFLDSNEELWCGVTQRRRVWAESPPSFGVYKTARRRRNLRHSLLCNRRQPAPETSPCLATTTALETTPWGLSGVPVTFLSPPPSASTFRVWASEMLSACPVAVRTEPGSWAMARRPAVNLPAASQPTASPAAVKLPATLLLVAMCQDPATEPVFLQLLLTPLDPASQCLIDRWPMCPAARDPRAFCLVDIAPRVLCPVVFIPSALCPAASDLCALSSVDAKLCLMCSVLTVRLALPKEACSFFIPGQYSRWRSKMKIRTPRSSALFLVVTAFSWFFLCLIQWKLFLSHFHLFFISP